MVAVIVSRETLAAEVLVGTRDAAVSFSSNAVDLAGVALVAQVGDRPVLSLALLGVFPDVVRGQLPPVHSAERAGDYRIANLLVVSPVFHAVSVYIPAAALAAPGQLISLTNFHLADWTVALVLQLDPFDPLLVASGPLGFGSGFSPFELVGLLLPLALGPFVAKLDELVDFVVSLGLLPAQGVTGVDVEEFVNYVDRVFTVVLGLIAGAGDRGADHYFKFDVVFVFEQELGGSEFVQQEHFQFGCFCAETCKSFWWFVSEIGRAHV